MPEKPSIITARISLVRTDPIQYKPYAPEFVFTGEGECDSLFVEIPIDKAQVLKANAEGITLSFEGFGGLLVEIASGIENAHLKRITPSRR